jgi:hypothetical protein
MTLDIGDVEHRRRLITQRSLVRRWPQAPTSRRTSSGPLEFDGRTDSILQAYDRVGRRHLEYLLDRGVHADVPVAANLAIFTREYPRLVERGTEAATRFREEAS